jgi:hypothetical protein
MNWDSIWAADLDGTGSMHICSDGDPGCVEYIPRTEADRLVESEREVWLKTIEKSAIDAESIIKDKKLSSLLAKIFRAIKDDVAVTRNLEGNE